MTDSELVGKTADPTKLRESQYKNSAKLAARANLHRNYPAGPGPWFPWIAQHARLLPDMDVLEVGCGPGWLWAEAAPDFPAGLKLTLTDLSDGMVAEAKARVEGMAHYKKVETLQADAAALPFAGNSFDAVLACHMLYHVPDPEGALRECLRVLRPGGILVAATNSATNMGELYAVGHKAFGGLAVDPAGKAFGLETAEEVIGKIFGNAEMHLFAGEMAVTDADDVVAALTSYPPGETASEAEVQTLRELVTQRMANEGGLFRINKRQGLIRAQKAG